MEFARVTYIMIVLTLDLLSVSSRNPEKRKEGDPLPSPGKCEPIRIPLCQGLSYSHTVMPNILGHANQEDAGLEIHQFYPLVKVQCSPELQKFLCSVYSPECENGTAKPVCRTTCETAKLGCEPVMKKFGFSWPTLLECESFTTEPCEQDLTAPEIQKKLVQTGHTVGDQVLSLQTVRVLVSLKDDERSGKLDEPRYQELQSYVSAAKREFEDYQRAKNGAVSASQMKNALTAHDLRLNDLNFGLLWDRYSTAGRINYDDFVALLARLETLKERFKSHRMTNLPCDCVMASFSLDDFIRDTLL
ncbi:frizzled-like [Colossoma macropomum]|uniref:frizzled-like n=1 Tax=Colossoma macropomum TaxID=42526 RepID=UPI001864C2A8|nr:frizzled-like [Colossoma macropomum]